MTIAEFKTSIDQLTDEERFFAAAHLGHRAQKRYSACQSMRADRMNRMAVGKKLVQRLYPKRFFS